MLTIRAFINLFFVPVVALFMFNKRNSIPLDMTFENLIRYVILVPWNIPFTRFFTYIIRIITGMNIEADSSYYTIAALLAAVCLPWIYEFVRKLWRELSSDEEEIN